ncbi:MAG: serpin family protein [Opitutae bacterium]|nr:serpin family protein [Opitutae bacterium]
MRTRSLLSFALIPLLPLASHASGPATIAPAINALGLDLYRQHIKTAEGKNVLLSPYSVASALAMTYAGAAGETKAEMQRVLRFPADQARNAEEFRLLMAAMQRIEGNSRTMKEMADRHGRGEGVEIIELHTANRLFAQRGYALRPAFLQTVADNFGAGVGEVDYRRATESVRREINSWVSEQTHERIPELIPEGKLRADARLTLVNALYLKAPWKDPFEAESTKPLPFHLAKGDSVDIPTMHQLTGYRYAHRKGCTIVGLPYGMGDLQLVLFVPDQIDGLTKLERTLTVADLEATARMDFRAVSLFLPKFKISPGTMTLSSVLQALGLKTAFDQPRGSANFDGMAPRKPDDYLAIDEVVHQTWLALDEKGTEAAAATAVVMLSGFAASERPKPPVEVRADRPFLFAIQHIESGACLFLGRVTDPRSE